MRRAGRSGCQGSAFGNEPRDPRLEPVGFVFNGQKPQKVLNAKAFRAGVTVGALQQSDQLHSEILQHIHKAEATNRGQDL